MTQQVDHFIKSKPFRIPASFTFFSKDFPHFFNDSEWVNLLVGEGLLSLSLTNILLRNFYQ